jgi:hypothetical protein
MDYAESLIKRYCSPDAAAIFGSSLGKTLRAPSHGMRTVAPTVLRPQRAMRFRRVLVNSGHLDRAIGKRQEPCGSFSRDRWLAR